MISPTSTPAGANAAPPRIAASPLLFSFNFQLFFFLFFCFPLFFSLSLFLSFLKKLLLLEEKNDAIMAPGRVGNRETEVELKDMDGDYGHQAGPI